jgi:DNA-binding CsgD family transcriptional regulator
LVTTETAKTHASHILTKLGLTRRAQIAAEVTRRQSDQLRAPDAG